MRLMTFVCAAATALALSACGGGDDQGAGGDAAGGLPESTTPADLTTLGGQLEEGWGVECDDEPFEDHAGFGKVVCTLPPEHNPGDGTGMALQSWSERSAVEGFEETFAAEGGIVVGDGWFVHAPTQEAADEAAAILAG